MTPTKRYPASVRQVFLVAASTSWRGGRRGGGGHPQLRKDPGFWESLKDLFMPDEDRATYAEGLRRGGYVVTVRTDAAHYEKAIDILDDEGTIDIDQRSETWRKEGWSGYSGSASSGHANVASTNVSGASTGRTPMSGT